MQRELGYGEFFFSRIGRVCEVRDMWGWELEGQRERKGWGKKGDRGCLFRRRMDKEGRKREWRLPWPKGGDYK